MAEPRAVEKLSTRAEVDEILRIAQDQGLIKSRTLTNGTEEVTLTETGLRWAIIFRSLSRVTEPVEP